ncbi:cytochrome b/b6 domain-containing protein [Paludibaculum fermentans]|uniref:cytochrome b/b6 domain-containing protein n=1 Tax=Paludibaculum fermentans TaxID=1473598 RepID=UPI003EBE456D
MQLGIPVFTRSAVLCLVVATGLWAGQKPVPAPTSPNSVCLDCHDQGAKLEKSAHNKVACASCHLKHDQYPHPENLPKPACITCHEQPATDYSQSEHAQQMKKGNGAAPECSTCHGNVHELAPALSESFHKSVPETCGMCHDKEAAQFNSSVHGKAVAAGVKDAPVCTDCHGGHKILKPDNPKSTVFSGSVPDTCGRCHGDVRLMSRFGLPLDRITSFNESFHGLALKAGSQSVADCSSCHGFHDILASDNPKSRTNAKNLATTCGACHPGAGSRFVIGSIHEVQGQTAPLPLQYAQFFYILVIPGTIGFMLLHHGGDFVVKTMRMRFQGKMIPLQMLKPEQPRHERMYKWERIQHILLALSFITLAYTGFALHFPDSWWARPTLAWEKAYPVRGVVHRTAGAILVLTSILHVVTLFVSSRLRNHWKEFLPVVGDLREMVEGTLWRLGLRKEKPYQSSHSYIEKIEYWALVWGTIVMAATGVLLWANNWSMKFLPKLWIDFARSVHFYEAVLATLAIFVWHFYSVIFDPDVYPMDPSWLTGYSPRPDDSKKHGH